MIRFFTLLLLLPLQLQTDYFGRKYYSDYLNVDSLRGRCTITVPDSAKSFPDGFSSISLVLYNEGSTTKCYCVRELNNRMLENDIVLKFIPNVYLSFWEFVRNNGTSRGKAFSVPFTIYPSERSVRLRQSDLSPFKDSLLFISNQLTSKKYTKKNKLSLTSTPSIEQLRFLAIINTADSVIIRSDSLIFVELTSMGPIYDNQSVYLFNTHDQSIVCFESIKDSAIKHTTNKNDPDYGPVYTLIRSIQREDWEQLRAPYATSDELDSFTYNILVIKKEGDRFLPILYEKTNKSIWWPGKEE